MMNQNLMISRVRTELRRKNASFSTERTTVRWIKTFFESMSLTHSSQIEQWQMEAFLSTVADRRSLNRDEILKARSSLRFLYNRVLKRSGSFVKPYDERSENGGVIRITA